MKTTITVPLNLDVKWDKEGGEYIANSDIFALAATGETMERAEWRLRELIQSLLGRAYKKGLFISFSTKI